MLKWTLALPTKNKNETAVKPINIDDIAIQFPMNTKYHSDNPISKWFISRFISSFLFLFSSFTLPQKILDIGCGEGLLLYQIQKVWPSIELTGLDVEKDLLNVAQQLVPEARYLNGNIYQLPLNASSYDMVICTEVLEHLKTPELAMKEILRIGNKLFLFSVPNEPWWRLANIARGCYLPSFGNTPGHLNHWGKSGFIDFISTYTKIISVKSPFPWTMILCQK